MRILSGLFIEKGQKRTRPKYMQMNSGRCLFSVKHTPPQQKNKKVNWANPKQIIIIMLAKVKVPVKFLGERKL